jgi:hypothetical protein
LFQKLLQLYSESISSLSHLVYESESDSENDEEDREQSEKEKEYQDRSTTFDCPENECVKRFRKYGNLLQHVPSGKHRLKLEKMTLLDRTKLLYKETLESVHDQPLPSLPLQFKVVKSTAKEPLSALEANWAVLTKKPPAPFSDKKKKYLNAKFDAGVQDMEWDPKAVALEMEVGMTNSGESLFERHEWLTDTQIKSFLGRIAAARRKQQSSHSKTRSSSSATPSQTSLSSKSDSDEESEDIDSTALDIDEIVTKVQTQSIYKSALHPNTAESDTLSQKKKDISNDDLKTAAKKQHK